MSKGNILKDSFYKERLSRTSNQFIKTQNNLHHQPSQSAESDTDEQVISPQYIYHHLDKFSLITTSICLILAKPHAEQLLPSDNSNAHTNICRLSKYPSHNHRKFMSLSSFKK